MNGTYQTLVCLLNTNKHLCVQQVFSPKKPIVPGTAGRQSQRLWVKRPVPDVSRNLSKNSRFQIVNPGNQPPTAARASAANGVLR